MKSRWHVIGIVLALLPGTRVHGENWPEFRGPTAQGIVPNGSPPTVWGPDKNVTWRKPIPGRGWSSPVVWEERIYLTTSVAVPRGDTDDQSLRALCLDAATGNVLWEREVFLAEGAKAPRIHSKNSHASPTPIIDGKHLYVHFGHLGTACLDLQGEILWRNTSLKYPPVHGGGGSPILVDDLLVFACDGGRDPFLVALERGTGKVRWKTLRKVAAPKTFSFGTPLVITVKGQKQIISQASNIVAAYEPSTGKEIWRVRCTGYSVVPRPVFGQGLLFISSGFDSPVLLAIRPDGAGDVTETHVAWKDKKAAPLTPSPLVIEEEVYTVSDSGMACCRDARTGHVHWQQRIGGSYSASPLYADGKIYFQSEQGPAVVIRAARKFEQLAKNSLGERALASYAAVKGTLFIRTEAHLYRVEAR